MTGMRDSMVHLHDLNPLKQGLLKTPVFNMTVYFSFDYDLLEPTFQEI
jgi:hypothetical protein